MKQLILIVIAFFCTFSLSNCKKENKINKELTGTWTISEYKRNNANPVTDFSTAKMTFEFIRYKKAYTQSMKAVYRVDYTDPAKTDMVDTIRYELKQEELTISKVQKSTNNAFLKKRFRMIEWKDGELYLERTDSANCYIKAVKN